MLRGKEESMYGRIYCVKLGRGVKRRTKEGVIYDVHGAWDSADP
jgi:hypothetical protein